MNDLTKILLLPYTFDVYVVIITQRAVEIKKGSYVSRETFGNY